MIRNDPKIENTCGSGNVIGRGGDGDQAHKTCDYDTHLTCRCSLTDVGCWVVRVEGKQQGKKLQQQKHSQVGKGNVPTGAKTALEGSCKDRLPQPLPRGR